jgi:hypothetical protein
MSLILGDNESTVRRSNRARRNKGFFCLLVLERLFVEGFLFCLFVFLFFLVFCNINVCRFFTRHSKPYGHTGDVESQGFLLVKKRRKGGPVDLHCMNADL